MLLLIGDGDWLIPSSEEGPRLEKAIPRCTLKVRVVHSGGKRSKREYLLCRTAAWMQLLAQKIEHNRPHTDAGSAFCVRTCFPSGTLRLS